MLRKSIAILTPVLPPYHGGIGKAALDEAEMLGAEHDVCIFTPKYKYIDRDEEQRGATKIRYIKPLFEFGNAAILPRLEKELRNFDIVYLHYPFFGVAEKFCIKSRVAGSKLVIRYHMDIVGRGWLKPFFWPHSKLIMPSILYRAQKIIVSSFDYARNSNIKNLFARIPEKFIEIPFGVDIEKFKPAPKDPGLLTKHNLSLEDKILLFVGSLDPAHYFKGLDVLLQTIYKLQDASYKLIVAGDGSLRAHYEKFSKKLGISNAVRFVGKVSNEELPKYYNLADVFVFPSIDRSEAFGIALLEAMSCGKAVLASRLPGVRTLIQEGENGFLTNPVDTKDISPKIVKAFNKSIDMGGKSREIILKNYERSLISTRLIRVFSVDSMYRNC